MTDRQRSDPFLLLNEADDVHRKRVCVCCTLKERQAIRILFGLLSSERSQIRAKYF